MTSIHNLSAASPRAQMDARIAAAVQSGKISSAVRQAAETYAPLDRGMIRVTAPVSADRFRTGGGDRLSAVP